MGSYEVVWKTSSKKEVRKLKKAVIPQVIKAVDGLEQDPLPRACRKLNESQEKFRIRVGEYRIIYQVNSKSKRVTIFHLRHRKDAYR